MNNVDISYKKKLKKGKINVKYSFKPTVILEKEILYFGYQVYDAIFTYYGNLQFVAL